LWQGISLVKEQLMPAQEQPVAVGPKEGTARWRRDPRESGGAARGRCLWAHRGGRLARTATAPPLY
jgi:hypothetical protein